MPRSILRATVVAALISSVNVSVGGGRIGAQDRPEPPVCITELNTWHRAGQVLLALVDDPGDAVPALNSLKLGGIAPIGTVDENELAAVGEALAAGRIEQLLASDEEGGTVQRFRDVLGPMPGAATQASTMTASEVEDLYGEYARQLAEIGVGMAFAPVVDVGGGPAIGSRSYGDDPAVVTEYARAVATAYQDWDIVPVLKHFPGHGSASGDTHDGLASTPPLEELRERDLPPFVDLLADGGDIAVMVGHLVVPGLTDGRPASLSEPAISGLLRDELGFDGLVISDALGMGAIRQTATPAEAAIQFLAAGGDLAIVDLADVDEVHNGILLAAGDGRLPVERLAEAVERVLTAKGVELGCGSLPAETAPPSSSTAPESDPSATPPSSGPSSSSVVPSATAPPTAEPATSLSESASAPLPADDAAATAPAISSGGTWAAQVLRTVADLLDTVERLVAAIVEFQP